MSKTYSCKYACGMVFFKTFELKKHHATHENPESVHHCPMCDFITLQKKNLAIHIATHTGEKAHACPDFITITDENESVTRVERCGFRTNDPAALTKHRKRLHGYIPPPNRCRTTKASPSPFQKRQGNSGNVPRLSQIYYPTVFPYYKPAGVSGIAHRFSSSAAPIEPSNAQPLYPRHGNMNTHGQIPQPSLISVPSAPPVVSSIAPTPPNQAGQTYTLDDILLCPDWMARYEMGYSNFDLSGMKHLPEPVYAEPSLTPAAIGTQTGREGCLCPEWMVEAGVEGWDQSLLDTFKAF